MAGHVFLTYSASDSTDPYVQLVVGRLTAAGLSVHAQQETNAHTVTPATRKLVDACGVLVPVILPSTAASERVRLEVEYARTQGKPVLPLWVEGAVPPWLRDTPYDNVAGRRPPSPPFVERLRAIALAAVSQTSPTPGAPSPAGPAPTTPGTPGSPPGSAPQQRQPAGPPTGPAGAPMPARPSRARLPRPQPTPERPPSRAWKVLALLLLLLVLAVASAAVTYWLAQA